MSDTEAVLFCWAAVVLCLIVSIIARRILHDFVSYAKNNEKRMRLLDERIAELERRKGDADDD